MWSFGFIAVIAGIVWGFKQMPPVHVEVPDNYFAAFDQESQRIVNHIDEVVEIMSNHTGAHLEVNVYVDNELWGELSEAEKLAFAQEIGEDLHNSTEEPMVVDFHYSTGQNVVVEGSLYGEYTVID